MEGFTIKKRYEFRGKLVPIIHWKIAKRLINMQKNEGTKINLTLDRYSSSKVIREDEEYLIEWGDKTLKLFEDDLRYVIKKENKLFYFNENGLNPLEIRSQHYYKLVLATPKPYPTLEIDGIHMHRIVGIDPMSDSKIKVSVLKGFKERILDICTGLGYTAILAKKRAREVITIEKDENVLKLAEYNPWSHDLANIKIINADASEVIYDFPSEYFDGIIHDPPRFSMAGELYSQEFYNELFRILRDRGVLFHYTGKPHSKYRGKSLVKGIGERLARAGFKVRFDDRRQGYIAFKKVSKK